MRVSVVCADSTISVDGVGRVCAFDLPEGVRAIQWDGAVGYFERRRSNGGGLEFFSNPDVIAPYVAAWSNAPEVSVRVEVPGVPEEGEWFSGSLPGGRDVQFTEVLNVDTTRPAEVPPPSPDSLADPGDAGGSGDEVVGVGGNAGGIMVGEATLDERKNILSLAIDDACEDRIEARTPAGYAERLAYLRSQYMGFKAGSLPPLTDDEGEELSDLEALDAWINRMRAYGAATRRALRAWSLEQLDAFDVAAADWPSP